MNGVCHHCHKPFNVTAGERIGRRDSCSQCSADLHCCLNCALYAANHDNQCREPQAERQVDKTIGNFCEYFELRSKSAAGGGVHPTNQALSDLDKLFKKG